MPMGCPPGGGGPGAYPRYWGCILSMILRLLVCCDMFLVWRCARLNFVLRRVRHEYQINFLSLPPSVLYYVFRVLLVVIIRAWLSLLEMNRFRLNSGLEFGVLGSRDSESASIASSLACAGGRAGCRSRSRKSQVAVEQAID